MRRLILAAVLLGGCAAAAEAPAAPKKGACACERVVCVCPHCKGAAACPCREVEKPK